MTEAIANPIWNILSGILTLNPDAFNALRATPNLDIDTYSILIVLLAGLSQSVAQAIILFVNRVKPVRFVISLLLGAVLFGFGYLFWGLSIWLAGLIFLSPPIPLRTVADVLAFSYLPLVFSFFGAMPYLGVPLLRLLAVWNLLAMVVGFSVLANLPARVAFLHVLLGWIVLIVVQQTVGQPIANLGQWLFNKAAGVKLVRDKEAVKELIYGAFPALDKPPQANAFAQMAPVGVDGNSPLQAHWEQDLEETRSHLSHGARWESSGEQSAALRQQAAQRRKRHFIQRGLQLVGLGGFTFLVAIALDPLRGALTGWYTQADPLLGLLFDLLWISLVALAIGGLLAPIEALGWWAGWYGDDVQTVEAAADDPLPEAAANCHRYAVYLDGIGQTSTEYQPAVDHFLTELDKILPDDIRLIQGLMSYSVLNRALTEDRPLAFFWRLADKIKDSELGGWLPALFINLRNVLAVTVSADLRYGPIFNRGIAQQIYTNLMSEGYPPQGGVPLTLIGYSGGGQIAMGALPFLKRALRAPIEVIS
ncbi:MAG TPA: CAAX protease, partial [Trichocoleus sp.]